MFTGIVERTGKIAETRSTPAGRRLRIEAGPMAAECALGASLAVDGVCLTVVDKTATAVVFDVITETIARSTLGGKRAGDHVNLERSLKIGDRIDGHFVQGHIDGTAVVERLESTPQEHVIWLRPDAAMMAYVIPKGSIAVDGVSLTIAAVKDGTFSVALIPTTLDVTTLSSLSRGDRVNIETDIITRTVVERLKGISGGGGLTAAALREAGFA